MMAGKAGPAIASYPCLALRQIGGEATASAITAIAGGDGRGAEVRIAPRRLDERKSIVATTAKRGA